MLCPNPSKPSPNVPAQHAVPNPIITMKSIKPTLTALLSAIALLNPTAIAPAESAQTEQGIELRGAESQLTEQYTTAIEAGRDRRHLERIPLDERTPEQQQRLEDLRILQRQFVHQFREFLDSPEVQQLEASRQRQATLPLEDLAALQDNLQRLERPAAIFYPLLLEDRIELVLLTPDASPLTYTVPVSRAEVSQAVAAFRQSLGDPSSDPRPVAEQLYQWLIQPMEVALTAAGTEALLYAPDGALRYIPLAALHDGESWLTERFIVNRITAATLTDLERSPQAPLRVLAAAHTEGTYDIELGDRPVSLTGLPGTGAEVEAIAAIVPETTVLLNEAFTTAALRSQMNNYTVLHLASNSVFVPGSPQDSFILMGNGDRVTLADMRNWSLQNVDLVVLSACETGIGGFDNGEEILGFGYLAQQAGARAAIASLWAISDGSTPAFMEAFYRALQEGSSYGAALRQAQLSMIKREDVSPSLRGTVIEGASLERNPLAHPYYWAPFILIGNGL